MSTLGAEAALMDSVDCESRSQSGDNRQVFREQFSKGDESIIGTNPSIFKAVKNTLSDSKQ